MVDDLVINLSLVSQMKHIVNNILSNDKPCLFSDEWPLKNSRYPKQAKTRVPDDAEFSK